MISKIVILGGHIQALGLARQAKDRGLTVCLVVKDGFSVARFSRAVDQTFVCGDDPGLMALLGTLKGKDVLLFPTSDDYIDFILQNHESLAGSFMLALPPKETAVLFADKRLTYRFAEKNGIPHPKSWYPTSDADVQRIAGEVSYPVVLKPAIMFSFHKLFGKKAFLCHDKDELLRRIASLGKSFPVNQLIIQEFLPGGPRKLYSYGVFAVDGEPVAGITVNRIRQNPMDFGNSTTFALTCSVPEMEESAKKILRLTRYSGLAEIEFMYHDGEYKFLEVNTRAWKWHTISLGRGFGFLSVWVDCLNGKDVKGTGKKDAVFWEERLTDWFIVAKEFLKGTMTLRDAMTPGKGKMVHPVWSLRDPLPAVMYVLLSPVLFFKRH